MTAVTGRSCGRRASGTEASSRHSFRAHSNAVCPAARPPATCAWRASSSAATRALYSFQANAAILYHLVQFARICGLVECSMPEPYAPFATRGVHHVAVHVAPILHHAKDGCSAESEKMRFENRVGKQKQRNARAPARSTSKNLRVRSRVVTT